MSAATPKAHAAIHAALREYWGYDTLRPLQAEAIDAGLAARDSLVVLPTGGGKSLCYQIPAVITERTDVVVSPLISLMKDQVDGLIANGYPAAALHSGLSTAERQQVERNLLAGHYRLLFVTPERLQNDYLRGLLRRINARSFAIDEAHCISHWGHDFRPEYRRLSGLRDAFPDASLHAYTATATERVRTDICAQLDLRDPTILVGTFDRPNLIYRVIPKQDVMGQVLQVLQRHEREAAIVYCLSRRDTEELAGFLQGHQLRAAPYHAGLDPEVRRATQDAFSRELVDVVVATVAFGMGIDRSDVRCVIHASVPKSIEHYQQETGRAGRDGLEAECVLFYSYADVARWTGLIKRSAAEAEDPQAVIAAGKQLLAQMDQLCTSYTCRHRAISEYFGQAYPREKCEACDICLDEVVGVEDATVTAQKVLSCVARVDQRFGVGHVADVLLGANTAAVRERGHDQLSTYGLLRDMDKKRIQSLIFQLVGQGLLRREGAEYPVLKLTEGGLAVMRGQRDVRLRDAAEKVKRTRVEADAWEGVDPGLFENLRGVRKELADMLGKPAFVVATDRVLRDLARLRPTTEEGLAHVPGLGRRKLAEHGATWRDAITTYCREHGLATDVADVADAPVRRGRRRRRV